MGTPQHLPEAVWLPLPLVLRIWQALCFRNPFWDLRATGHAAPGTPKPEVPVFQNPPSAAGMMGPFLSASPPPNPQEGGREGTERGGGSGLPSMTGEGVGSEGRVWEAGTRRGSADGEAEAALELVLPVIQEGPEGQRQGQGRELLLQCGAHDPVAVHRACGQTAAVRAMCPLPTVPGVTLQATSDTTSQMPASRPLTRLFPETSRTPSTQPWEQLA